MESRIDQLLRLWVDLQQRGADLTPEDLCAGDADLLRELRLRVSASGDPETAMEGDPALGRVTDDTASTLDDFPPRDGHDTGSVAGFAIGQNEILEELGRGGMGVVFCVWQPQINRVAALKMVTAAEYAGRPAFLRFEIEIEAVGRLQHPNIVQIYEVGEHQGRPYFVYEYVAGGSLADLLREGPLMPAAAAQLVQTLAEAVHHAHQRGIVHRDLKPTNVLLTAAGVPKLTDFGLAKLMQSDSGLTETGMILGTAGYMAPEQALGLADEVGPRTDVYALGALLYETLTGHPPFRGETLLDTLRRVREDAPVPPSHVRYVPRDLERICQKCLARHKEDRYPTAQDLADDLVRFLTGRPVHVRPVGLSRQFQRWCQRPRRIVEAGVALLGVGLLLELWVLLLPLVTAGPARALLRPSEFALNAIVLTACFHLPLIWSGTQMIHRRYRGILAGVAVSTAELLFLTLCAFGFPLRFGGLLDEPERRLVVFPLLIMLSAIAWAASLIAWCAFRTERLQGRT